MEFNEKLQKLRKQKGITQEELAKELFVSRTAVSKWESGRGYPGIDSLKDISKFFGVTIDELLLVINIFTVFMVAARIFSGVHWFTDIIGGILISFGLMFMYVFVIKSEKDNK